MSTTLWELDGEGRTPLMAVADDWLGEWEKKVDSAIDLLRLARSSGVDLVEYVRFGEGKGDTFLHFLVRREITGKELKRLLGELKGHLTREEYKAVLEVRDEEGCTPFLAAMDKQNWEAAEVLLEEGASPRATTFTGANAVHILIGHGNPFKIAQSWPWVVRLIRKEYLDPNARIRDGKLSGMTALHLASLIASEGYYFYGGTPYDVYPILVEKLLNMGARANSPLRPVLDGEGKEVPLYGMTLSELEVALEGSPVGLAVGHPGVLRKLREGAKESVYGVHLVPEIWANERPRTRGIFLPVHLRKAEGEARQLLAALVSDRKPPEGGIESEEVLAWYGELLELDWVPVVERVKEELGEEYNTLKKALGYLESMPVLLGGIWELYEEPGGFGLTLGEEDRARLWSFIGRVVPLVEKLRKLKEKIEQVKKAA